MGSWPQTTCVEDYVLFGPLLQARQEKASEKHRDTKSRPLKEGQHSIHILIGLFLVDRRIKETLRGCSTKQCAYDPLKTSNLITAFLHASPPN